MNNDEIMETRSEGKNHPDGTLTIAMLNAAFKKAYAGVPVSSLMWDHNPYLDRIPVKYDGPGSGLFESIGINDIWLGVDTSSVPKIRFEDAGKLP